MLSESAGEVGSKAAELRAIAKGAGINLVGYLSIMALTLAFQFLLARTQGPSLVGIIGLALSVTGIATVLALFGLHSGVLRFVALYAGQGDRARAAGAILTGVRTTTVLSLVVGAVLFGAADQLAVHVFDTPALSPVLRLLALSLPLAVAMQYLLSVTQGLKRMEYRTAIECILVPSLKIGGLVMVAYLVGRSAVGVAAVLAVTPAIGAVLAAIAVWRLYPLRGRRQRPVLLTRTVLAFSWPLLLMAVVNRTWQESETLVLGAFAPSDQVGIYYMCTRVTVLLAMFLFAFSDIFAIDWV
jgi:O-antigen/teichoic acid export membrane protein